MENDFLHTGGDNATKYGWQPQEYNVSAKDARGPYGKDFDIANVELNPLKDPHAWTGDSKNGGDAGLRLWVRGDHSSPLVGCAEVATVRDDTLYGSYRVGMKLSSQNGTCGAFFWVRTGSLVTIRSGELTAVVLQQLARDRPGIPLSTIQRIPRKRQFGVAVSRIRQGRLRRIQYRGL